MERLVDQFNGNDLLHYAAIAKEKSLLDGFARGFFGKTGSNLRHYKTEVFYTEK